MLWVDIIPAADVLKHPKIDIMGPEKMKFELRVVCWRSMDVKVHGMKQLDLFATFFMEGGEKRKQSTDTHWFCKNGAGSWNWRIKIPLELPIKARELGKLKIQLWEKNVITANTIVGEGYENLYDWLMLAYRRQTSSVSPFKEERDAEKKWAARGYTDAEEGEGESNVDALLADNTPETDATGDERGDGNDEEEEDDDHGGSDYDGGDIEKGTVRSVISGSYQETALDDDTTPLLSGGSQDKRKSKKQSGGGGKNKKASKTANKMSSSTKSADKSKEGEEEEAENTEEESEAVLNMVNVSGLYILSLIPCCIEPQFTSESFSPHRAIWA